MVGSGDYALWKSTYGSTLDLRADGNGDGRVDTGDYVYWRNRLAEAAMGSGGGGLVADASEPASEPLAASAPPPNLAGLQFATVVATPGSSLDGLTLGSALATGSSDTQLELLDAVLGELAQPAGDDDFDSAASTFVDGNSDDADADEALALAFDEVTDWRYGL
jgi:hypothetical protein